MRFVRFMYITMFCRTSLGKGYVVFCLFSFVLCFVLPIIFCRIGLGKSFVIQVCIPAARCMKKEKKEKKNRKKKKKKKIYIYVICVLLKSKDGVCFIS